MTSLAVSLSVDSRGPCALYIVTDSRITWDKPDHRWDSGQKTFASHRFPDVFGFCGDAFFPPMMLRQIVQQLDAGLICPAGANAEERHTAISRALEVAMEGVSGLPPMLPFVIYHGAREGDGITSTFKLWEKRYAGKKGQWSAVERAITKDCSYLAHLDGTGATVVRARESEWRKSSAAGTSRSAIWAFCEALHSGKDSFSGGAPQLVGLWRVGAGKHFGFLWHGKPHLAGLEVVGSVETESVQWFNHLFERSDASTGRRLKSAQKHIKPRGN